MTSIYSIIIVLSFLSGLTTLIGVALAFYFQKNTKLISAGIGFSAGIMLLISCFELIPEALSEISIFHTTLVVLLGALIMFVLSTIIPHIHLMEDRIDINKNLLIKTSLLVAFGLILHDVPEGFAMANSFIASPSLGLFLAIAIALHNIPEEFAMAVPMVAIKSKKFLFKAAFVSALAEPIGALIGILFVHFWTPFNSHFLAIAAGAMIFISLHELVPMARKYGNLFLFFVGITLSVLIYFGLNILLP